MGWEAEPSVGREEARVGKALKAAVAAGWSVGAESAVLSGDGSGAVEDGPGGRAVEEQGWHGRVEPSAGRAESRVGKMLVEAVKVRWPARAESAALPGQGGGAVEGGPGGEAVVEQGREGGAEPSVGRAEARVGNTVVEAVEARWPVRAEANCRAAM